MALIAGGAPFAMGVGVAAAGVASAGVAFTGGRAGVGAETVGSGDVSLTPSQAVGGESVSIKAPGCVSPVTAQSEAFQAGAVTLKTNGDSAVGSAVVSRSVQAGVYNVTVTCHKGGPFNGYLGVIVPSPTPKPTVTFTQTRVPGPRTGGGGMAARHNPELDQAAARASEAHKTGSAMPVAFIVVIGAVAAAGYGLYRRLRRN
jgi:hypothetical protein